jgi:cytochrome c oxidase subunit IV
MTNPPSAAISERSENSLYFIVWVWLVVLLAVGLSLFGLPIPREVAVALIFSVAAVKAVLILRNYMHLKHEHFFIYLIVLVPLLFFLGLALTLIPDLVFRHAM